MTTKTVRLDEDVYQMLAERKRDDETFSDAVERLVGGRPLVELAGIYSEEEVREIEDALDAKYQREKRARSSELDRS